MRRQRSLAIAILIVSGLVTTCKLDNLVTPPTAKVITAAPTAVTDSAPLGSTAPHTATFSFSGDQLSWSITRALNSAWLLVTPGNGVTPSAVTITANPTGLTRGSHYDTLVVEASGASPIRVPLEFRIHDCVVTPMTLDSPVAGPLSNADCGAPHRSGRFSKIYRFNGSAGDSVSLSLTSPGFDAYVFLDTTLAGTPLRSNDNCASTGNDACIRYMLLREDRPYLVEVTTAAAGETGPFNLIASRPRAPDAPDSPRQLAADSVTAIGTGGTAGQSAVVIDATGFDPDDDSLNIEVEVQPVGTGFGTPAAPATTLIGARVASGQRAVVRVPSLSDNVAYHWRARFVDQTGRPGAWMSYGGNAESAADFTLAIPEAPADPAVLAQYRADGISAVPVGGLAIDPTAVLKATLTDPDPGDQLRLEVEVRPVGTAFSGAATASSVPVASGGVAQVAAPGLADNTAYHWQARTVDQTGRASAWIAFGGNAENASDFRIALPPAQLVFVSQPGNATAGTPLTVQVAARDADGNLLHSFSDNVTLTLGSNPGGGTLSGVTTVAAVSGVATFSGLTLDQATTGYAFRATVGPLVINSAPFSVVPGAATQLVFTGQPSGAAAGGIISPAVQVTARDAMGNTATGYAGGITIALGSNSTGASLTGTVSASAVAGVATFSNLSVNRSGTGYTLAASALGLAGATSNPFPISLGGVSLSTSSVTTSTSSVASGNGITLTLRARDASGDDLTTGGLAVVFSAGGGTSTGTIGSTVDHGDGTYTATFTGGLAGTATTIGATIGGAPVTSTLPVVVVTPGLASAARSVVSVSSPALTSGAVATLTLQTKDAAGNSLVAGGLTVVFNQSGGTSSGTIGTTIDHGNGSYTTTFTAVVAGTPTTIGATINGAPVTTTLPTIRVTAEVASTAQSLISVSAPTVVSGNSVTLTLLSRDAAGNDLTAGGLVVAFSSTGGASTGVISATTDHGDGTYTATFTGVLTGTATTIGATIGGAPVTSATPTVSVTPGIASTATSEISVSSPAVVSGATVTLTLRARDAAGNALTTGGLAVEFGLGSGTSTGTISSVTDQGDGTYTATFTGVLAGTGRAVTATIDASAVATASPTVTVTAGAVSLSGSSITVASSTVQSGSGVTATLTARDAAGNAVGTGGLTVAFTATGGTSTGTFGAVTDHGNGSYTATFTGTVSGTATAIGATINAAAVTSAHPTITVTPGAVSVATSQVSVSSGTIASGGSATITLQAKDAVGNHIVTGGLTVVFTVTGGTSTGTLGATTDHGDGTYTATFTGAAAGTAKTVSATIGGVDVATAMPTITVVSGNTASTSLSLVTTSSNTVTSGSTATLTLETRDAAGNNLTSGGFAVVFGVSGGTSTGTVSATTDHNDGTYTATFTGLLAGTPVTVGATIGGVPVSSALPTIAVTPGAASTASSLVTTSSASIASGTAATLTLRVRDAAGNDVATGGLVVSFTATGGTSTGTIGAITDNGDGTYSASYSGVLAGTAQTIGATIGGSAVTSTLPTLTVTPGTVSLTTSTVTVPSASLTSGSSFLLTLHARDAAGNALTTGGFTVAFSLSGGTSTGTIGTTTDLNNGRYTASVTGVLAGTPVTVGATIGGAAVTSTLPTVTVTPGAAASITKSGGDLLTGAISTTLATPHEVLVADAAGNPVAGTAIVWAAATGGGSATPDHSTTDANGHATTVRTLGSMTGTQTTTATAAIGGSPVSVTFSVTATAGGASVMVKCGAVQGCASSGDGQTATAGTSLPVPLSVRVTDAGNNPVSGILISWSVRTAGGGTLSGPTSTTNASGVASVTWTLGQLAGVHLVQATGVGEPVNFEATATPGAASPSVSILGAGSSSISSGSSTTLALQTRDGFGNALTSGGLTVVFGVAGGTSTGTISTTTDHGNGIYSATFTGVLAGTATTVGATINGSPVTSTAPAIAVTPGTVSTSTSTISSAASVASGSAVTLVLQARDAQGNNLLTGGLVVAFAATGGTSTGTIGAITDHGNGTYSASFAGVLAGTAKTIGATIGGVPVTSPLPTVAVTPGAASGAQSQVTVSAASIASGATATLTLHAKDAAGNDIGAGGGSVSFSATGGTSTGTIGTVTDHGDGTYTAIYTGVLAGTARTIGATINGSPVTTALPTVAVTAGSVSVANSFVTSASGTIPSGAATTLTLQARDAAGNNLPTGGLAVAFTASGGTGTSTGIISAVTDHANGTYTATFTGVLAGTATTIGATVGGEDVTTVPTIVVTPGSASTATSTVTTSSATVASGSSATLTLTARDAAGNRIISGGLTVVFSATGGTATGTVSATADHIDGTYTATFTGVGAGTAKTIGATIGGAAVATTLPTIAVTTGGVSLSTSTVTVSAANVASGSTSTVTLHARDAAGNDLAAGGLAVAFSATGGTSTGNVGVTTDHGDGTYTATFTGVLAGTATTISATIAAVPVTSAPPTITVTPGNVSLTTSTLSGSSGTVASGNAVTLTLRAKDAAGNNLFGGGLVVAFNASVGTGISTGTIGSVTDHADGTYTASFTGVTAGTATTMHATIAGTLISATAPVTVTAGAAAHIAKSDGDNLNGQVNTALGTPHEVLITDAAGNPVPSASVFWAAASGGGSVTPDNSVTDAAGHATTVRTLGPGAGPQTTSATTTISGSPVSVTFNISATSGGASQMTKCGTLQGCASSGDGQAAVVGTALPVPLSVRVTDASNNPVQNVIVSWSVRTTGGGTLSGATSTTNSSGIASITWTLGPTAGLHVVRATAVGEPANFTATANPGAVSTSASVVSVGNSTVTSGSGTTVTLQARDAFGNNLGAGGLNVAFNFSGGTSTGIFGPTSDHADGTYTATFTGVTSGTASAIGATIGTTAVTTTAPTITVTPGAVSTSTSLVTVSNSTVASGNSVTVTLRARDAAGNNLPAGGLTVAFSPGTGTSTGTLSAVVDHADGTYSASFTGVNVGTARAINTTIGGNPVTSTPPTVTVVAGTASAVTSSITVGASQLNSGSATTLTLQARDAAGNSLTSGGLNVAFTGTGGTSTGTITPTPASDQANGTYTATFTGVLAGSATTIAGTINGTSVSSTLPTIQVVPGAASAATTTAAVPAGTAGSNTTITITVRDANGNVRTTGADAGVLAASVTGSNPASPSVVAAGSGTYTATYQPTQAGTDNIAITLGGSAIGGSPFTSSVGAGAANAAQTTATVPAGTAGTPTAITITVRDAQGNIRTAINDVTSLAVVVSGANAATPTVLSAGVGTYTTSYTPTQAGTDNVSITLGGLPISGSAFTSAVSAGAANAAHTTASVPAGTAGAVTTVTITVRDVNHNVRTAVNDAASLAVAVSGANTANPTVTSAGLGVYTATYTPAVAGTDNIAVTLGATAISGSPLASAVSAGAANAAHTTATVPGGTAGSATTVTITVRDLNNNIRTATNDAAILAVTVSGANTAAPTVTSSGLGVYTATYTPTVAGTDNVAITVSGTAIASSPFTSPVTAGTANATHTTATAPAGTAGSVTTVTITVRDAQDNIRTGANDAAGLAVTVSGANSATPIVSSAGSGVYTASYSPTATGTDNIAVTLNGTPISGSPLASAVSAGAANAAHTTASVPAGTAGSATTVTITVRDVNDNVRTANNDAASLAVTVSGANTSLPTVTSSGLGVYTATYTPTAAGTDNIAITLGGTQISGSTFTSAVGAGAASAAHSSATAPAGTAGTATTVTVTVRDVNDNIRSAANDAAALAVTITGANNATPTVSSAGLGAYTATYTPTAAGTDNIAITLNGAAISGSPLTSSVSAGAASAAQSTASVPAATAGSPTTATITVRDANDNVRTAANDAASLAVNVTGANAATPTVTSAGNGVYTATWTPTVAGTDNIAITLGGSGIAGSSFTSAVAAGAANAAHTTASVPAGTAGSATTVTITVRDGNDNVRTANNDAASLAVSVTGANTATPTVTSAGSGVYTATYTPTVVGTDDIAVTLGGSVIGGSPLASGVGAGAGSAAHTTASVPAGSAGSPTTVTITVRDANDNLRTAVNDAASLAVTVTGANTATPAVTSAGNGVYTATYTPTVSGTDNIAIALGGSPIAGSSFLSAVSAGAANAPHTTASVPAGTAGSPTTVTITVRDVNDNIRTASNDAAALEVSVTGANTVTPTVTSAGLGVYTATWTPTVAGTDNVAITLGGAAISGSTFTSTVAAGAASAVHTSATVPAGTAGSATTVTITVRDGNNNIRTANDDAASLAVTVTGANTGTPTVTSAGLGVYTATYTPVRTGTDDITITLGGTEITGSAFTSAVAAGAASAAQTTATVPAGTAGAVTTATITVRDASGNIRTANNDAAALAVTITGANTATPTVISGGLGVYTAAYTPTAAGIDNLAITLDGTPVAGSTYSSTVTAGAANPAHTTATAPAGTAGSPTTVTITVRDVNDNVRTGVDDAAGLAVGITGANTATPNVVSAGSGIYTATYTPITAGTDGVVVTLSGTGISGSPLSSAVGAGLASASHTTAAVPAGTAGTATTISITVRDANNNIRTATDDAARLAVAITGANSATPTVTSAGLGVYTATYTPTATGSDDIAIQLDGTAIASSPATSAVSAGAPSAAQTIADVPAGTAGTATTIAITVRDANNNIRTATDDAALLAVAITGANNATPTVTSAGLFVYTATYTPTSSGTDHVAITLSASAITSSPFTSLVSAGTASATHTTASVPAGAAGSSTTITITVRDANDNLRSANDDAGLLAVTISGANSAAPSIVSQGAGVYTATYTPTAAGTDQVVIELDGSGIAGSAFTSSVAAGDAAAIEVSDLPDAPNQGTAYDFTLTLRDAFGNVATGYSGTVDFAVAPGTGTVPAGYTFVPGDAGVHTFSAGVTFGSDGAQTLTATDVEHGLTGSRDVTVTPAGP